jgi:hypothetical protein
VRDTIRHWTAQQVLDGKPFGPIVTFEVKLGRGGAVKTPRVDFPIVGKWSDSYEVSGVRFCDEADRVVQEWPVAAADLVIRPGWVMFAQNIFCQPAELNVATSRSVEAKR